MSQSTDQFMAHRGEEETHKHVYNNNSHTPIRTKQPGPKVIKLFFMLNSTEHKISTAHKTKIPTNKEVTCFMSLRCGILSC